MVIIFPNSHSRNHHIPPFLLGYDTISPKLFITLYAFKNIDWENMDINVNGENLNHLRFADDIGRIEDAKEMLNRQDEASK